MQPLPNYFALLLCSAVKHLFSFTKAASKQPDPVISRLRPDRHFGSISEHMNKLIDNYMSANPDKVVTDISLFDFHLLNYNKLVLFDVARCETLPG